MGLRVLLFLCLLALVPVSMAWQQETPKLPTPRAQPDLVLPIPPRPLTGSAGLQFVGAGSCSAAACHNGNGQPGQPRTEYSSWLTRDPHARAYEILYDDRSVRIQKNLHVATAAHKDQRCLSCHVSPSLSPVREKNAPHFRVDGVSCESCHGPAEKWVSLHFQDSWKEKSVQEKEQLGMTDTQSILGRAKVCVGCHVGGPGQDVDHDLIAAGHPRLNFEFSAFHAGMPHHWPDYKDRDPEKSPGRGRADFEACAWVVGQIVTAHAAVDLLAERAANDKKPWPEFSEHDCFACHHDLKFASWRQQRAQQPAKIGSLVWSPWYTTMVPSALQTLQTKEKSLSVLRKEMRTGWKNRKEIAWKARQSAKDLHGLIGQLDRKLAEPFPAETMLRKLLAENTSEYSQSWDEAKQYGLALAALERAERDMKLEPAAGLKPALQGLFRDLDFPKSYDSPRSFDPQAVRQRLLELHDLRNK